MVTNTIYGLFYKPDYEKTTLMQSNYMIWGIILSYILFVKRIGPAIMKNRNPMDLRYTIMTYNTLTIAVNAYLSLTMAHLCWKYWNVRCYVRSNPEFTAHFEVYAYVGFQILLIKIVELLDTVFFVLRKKNSQASFVHIFHHSIVILLGWTVLKRRAVGYYMLLTAAINCGIHMFTYLYYTLAAMGPTMKKYLWWKKHLTILQMSQFLVLMFYIGYSIVTDCEEFGFYEKALFAFLVSLSVLFLNFYHSAYKKNTRSIAKP